MLVVLVDVGEHVFLHHPFPLGMRNEGAVAADDKGVESVIFVVEIIKHSIMITAGIDDLQLFCEPFQRQVGTEDTHYRVSLVVEGHDKRADVVVLSDIIEIGIRPEAGLRFLALGIPFFAEIVMVGRADVPWMFIPNLIHIDLKPPSILREVVRLESDEVALSIVVQFDLILHRFHYLLGRVQPVEHFIDDISGAQLLCGENPFQFLVDHAHDRLVLLVCQVLDSAEGDTDDDTGNDNQCCQRGQHHLAGQPVGERLIIRFHSLMTPTARKG